MCEAEEEYTVEFKSENDKIVIITNERDEFGEWRKVECSVSMETAQRLHRELGDALYDCRNYLVLQKVQQVEEAKAAAGKSTLKFPVAH